MSKKILTICAIIIALGVSFLVYQNIMQPDNHPVEKFSKMQEEEMWIYETKAGNANECSSYETYNEESSVCYYECSSDEECDDIGANIDEEIAGWYDENRQDGEYLAAGDETALAENDDSLRAEYLVSEGEILTLNSGEGGTLDHEIWELVSKISPDWLTDDYVDSFQIFENSEDDTLAFVDDEDGDGKWRVGVNIATFATGSEKEKNLTIVHELGHIITLNTSQMNTKKTESQCPLGFIDEGCPENKSYLAGFVKLFWTKADITESGKHNSKLFDQKPTNFITDYASTSFVEDIAESFAYFVFGDSTTNTDSIARQKQQYFAQFPELVKTRDEMRSGVKSNIIRARRIAGNK